METQTICQTNPEPNPEPNMDRRQEPERRKENKLVNFQDRRAAEYRRAADREQQSGNTTAAILWRNEAYRLECEQDGSGLHL